MSTKHAIDKAKDEYAYFKIYISVENIVLGIYMACYYFLHAYATEFRKTHVLLLSWL